MLGRQFAWSGNCSPRRLHADRRWPIPQLRPSHRWDGCLLGGECQRASYVSARHVHTPQRGLLPHVRSLDGGACGLVGIEQRRSAANTVTQPRFVARRLHGKHLRPNLHGKRWDAPLYVFRGFRRPSLRARAGCQRVAERVAGRVGRVLVFRARVRRQSGGSRTPILNCRVPLRNLAPGHEEPLAPPEGTAVPGGARYPEAEPSVCHPRFCFSGYISPQCHSWP